jgi:hypothetical protein
LHSHLTQQFQEHRHAEFRLRFSIRPVITHGQMRRIAPAVWGVWHHAITTIAFYTRGRSTRQRVRDCDLKELLMPDLDQIKQGEQELGTSAGGSPGVGRAIPRAARPPRPRQPRCPAIARGRGRAADPQSRRTGARRRPAPLRLCLERILGPHRERGVEFTMPLIRNAADLAGRKGKS